MGQKLKIDLRIEGDRYLLRIVLGAMLVFGPLIGSEVPKPPTVRLEVQSAALVIGS